MCVCLCTFCLHQPQCMFSQIFTSWQSYTVFSGFFFAFAPSHYVSIHWWCWTYGKLFIITYAAAFCLLLRKKAAAHITCISHVLTHHALSCIPNTCDLTNQHQIKERKEKKKIIMVIQFYKFSS